MDPNVRDNVTQGVQNMQYKYNAEKIQNELTRLRTTVNRVGSQFSFYIMTKLSDHFVDNVYLDNRGLNQVKNFVQDRKTRVVFLPMYKSFTDPLVMFYVNYFCNLEMGFSFYNNEDYPDVKFADYLYKKAGLILSKREDLQNLYINYVN